MSTTIIKNIGRVLSADINQPVLNATCILIKDGIIEAVDGDSIAAGVTADQTIDAKGATVMPGLMDSHVHTTIGDYGHRLSISGFIAAAMQGGVTTMISAGECHMPGRPRDAEGAKAMAVLAHKSFDKLRPAGVKVHGGALILEKGLVEKDFEYLAGQGV